MSRSPAAFEIHEAPAVEPPGMAGRPRVTGPAARTRGKGRREWGIWRFIKSHPGLVQYVLLAGVAALIFVAGVDQIAQFLANDPMFALPVELVEGAGADHLEVRGAVNTAEWRVRDVFAPDAGSGVYFVNLEERRSGVRQVDWVRDATVSRLWPDRLLVRVTERQPIAFLSQAASEEDSPLLLIDEEGILLHPPAKVGTKYNLPVLQGVTATQPLQQRRLRVQRMTALLQELAPYRDRISEIDATDARNLSFVYAAEGKPVQIYIGERNFARRFEAFLHYQAQIRADQPNACGFDVRSENWVVVRRRGEACAQ